MDNTQATLKRNSHTERVFETLANSSPLLRTHDIREAFTNIRVKRLGKTGDLPAKSPHTDLVACFAQPVAALSAVSPRYGFLRFETESSPGPEWMAFSPVYHPKKVTHIRLNVYNQTLDRYFVFREAFLRTVPYSAIRNSERAFACAQPWAVEAAANLADQRFEYAWTLVKRPNHDHAGNRMGIPGLVRYLCLTAKKRLEWIIGNAFIFEKWNIGTLPLTYEDLLTLRRLPPVNWLPPPRGTSFYADPFMAENGHGLVLLFEHFKSASRRGEIAHLLMGSGQVTGTLRSNTHLSYPGCFKLADTYWCVPESSAQNQVVLYRLNPESMTLEKERVLIDGFDGVDNTIHFYNDKWWMFSTRKKDRGADTHLFIHHAPKLEGPWTPHRRNPVKIDIRTARPAGALFSVNGVLYRPSQDSSVRYGHRIVINRITQLTDDRFDEKPVNVIGPCGAGGYDKGFHTINIHDGLAVVDGKQHVLTLRKTALLAGRLWRRQASK